jgi:hypothetical protein
VADKSAADIRTRTHGECGLSATFARTRSYRLADPYDPSVSPRAKHELAREHLDRGLAGVSANDATEAVAWLFLSLEAAIVSLADNHGLDTQRQHWKKAEVAEELHARGVLSTTSPTFCAC